jgi:hypothetical protein
MIVSKDIAWMDSSTPFLRGWCDLRPREQFAPPRPWFARAGVPDEPYYSTLYLPVLRARSSSDITARNHAVAARFECDDVLARREHHLADCDHPLLGDSLTDHGERLLSDLVIRTM